MMNKLQVEKKHLFRVAKRKKGKISNYGHYKSVTCTISYSSQPSSSGPQTLERCKFLNFYLGNLPLVTLVQTMLVLKEKEETLPRRTEMIVRKIE